MATAWLEWSALHRRNADAGPSPWPRARPLDNPRCVSFGSRSVAMSAVAWLAATRTEERKDVAEEVLDESDAVPRPRRVQREECGRVNEYGKVSLDVNVYKVEQRLRYPEVKVRGHPHPIPRRLERDRSIHSQSVASVCLR